MEGFLQLTHFKNHIHFYSPYTFSGNRVIDSGELEGLEPEDVISNTGKLSNAMIGLLHGAFLMDKTRLASTTWVSSKSPNLTTFQKIHFYNVTREPYATNFYKTVIFNESEKARSKSYWIGLVAHEQSHQEDQLKNGSNSFYVQYGADIVHYLAVTKKISTETTAYQIEDEYMPLLLQYKKGEVLDLFDPQKNSYTDNEKAPILEKLGAGFRVDVILQNEINKNNAEIKSYETIISDLKKSKGNNEMKIQDYTGDVNMLKKRNRQLKKEQDEIKKEYKL